MKLRVAKKVLEGGWSWAWNDYVPRAATWQRATRRMGKQRIQRRLEAAWQRTYERLGRP